MKSYKQSVSKITLNQPYTWEHPQNSDWRDYRFSGLHIYAAIQELKNQTFGTIDTRKGERTMHHFFSAPGNLMRSFILIASLMVSASCQQVKITGSPVSEADVYYENQEKAIVFAAEDLATILDKMGITATLKSLNSLSDEPVGTYFVIAKNNTDLQTQLTAAGGKAVGTLGEQDYVLRVTKKENSIGYWALGGDRIGAMYGGIHIGEIVAGGLLSNF